MEAMTSDVKTVGCERKDAILGDGSHTIEEELAAGESIVQESEVVSSSAIVEADDDQ